VTALIPIVGISPAIRYALDLVERFAPSKLPILLAGPPGSGKDLFAQEIHRRSGRSGSFVDVDCAALPRDVADGLLFGFRRGMFTGAHEAHVGLVEQSDRATLVLDELLGLFPEAQRKLLRVLETAAVRPLGERTKRTIDLRVVAAVQERVGAALQAGSLRDDLYDRLRGVVIELPPLAERPEDIVPLAEAFAGRHGRVLEHGAARTLLQYDWPGNVRELRLVIERAGYLVEDGVLPAWALRQAIALGQPGGSSALPREHVERARLLAAALCARFFQSLECNRTVYAFRSFIIKED